MDQCVLSVTYTQIGKSSSDLLHQPFPTRVQFLSRLACLPMRILRVLLQLIRRISTEIFIKHVNPRARKLACRNTFLEASFAES